MPQQAHGWRVALPPTLARLDRDTFDLVIFACVLPGFDRLRPLEAARLRSPHGNGLPGAGFAILPHRRADHPSRSRLAMLASRIFTPPPFPKATVTSSSLRVSFEVTTIPSPRRA